MSEHDPALVAAVANSVYDEQRPLEPYAWEHSQHLAIAAIDAVRAWDREHAEPSEAEEIADSPTTLAQATEVALRAFRGHWVIVDANVGSIFNGAIRTLVALRDAVKGTQGATPEP